MILNSKINVKKNFRLNRDNVVLKNNKFYNYSLKNIKKKTFFNFQDYQATIFVLNQKNSSISFNKKSYKIKKNTIIYLKNVEKFTIDKEVTILLAKKKINRKKPEFMISNIHKVYTVKKPWGYERWINGYNSNYAFKNIFIKRKNKTSLQYHKKKTETNFLIKGDALLVTKKNNFVKNKNVASKDLRKILIKSPAAINVNPPGLHRIIAKTNIELFEISSQHLDDVIRIQDDANRKSGKISSEHR